MVAMAEISNWFRSTETRIRKYVKNQKQLIIRLKGTVPCISFSLSLSDFFILPDSWIDVESTLWIRGRYEQIRRRFCRKPLDFGENERFSVKAWVYIHHCDLLETGKVERKTSNFKWLLKQGWCVMTSPKMVKMVKNVQIMKFGFAAKKKRIFHVSFIGLHFILWDQILNGCHPMIAVVKGHTIPI